MTNDWATTKQGATSVVATNHGEAWTPDDVEFVAANTESMTDEQLAYETGRTLYSIWSIQHRLANGEYDADAARRAYAARTRVVPTCPTCYVQLPATGVCDTCA